jgi:hypothetical protein
MLKQQQNVYRRSQLGDYGWWVAVWRQGRYHANDPDGLRTYFAQFGPVDACTIMRDPTGRSRGFAFLTFRNASSVNSVMDKDHQLDGKMVSAELACLDRIILAPLLPLKCLKAFTSSFTWPHF